MAEHQKTVFGISNPVVFVTGSGANRVGRVIARMFVERGYRAILHSHRDSEEARALSTEWTKEGNETHYVTGAINDEPTVKQWIDEIQRRFGRLDVLVNSAAVWEPHTLEGTDTARIRNQWESNTLGAFLVAKHAGLRMAAQPTGGAIVLIGDWAIARPYSDFAAYFVSKGSIPAMTRALAVELAERNPRMRVNAILPGPVMLDEKTPEPTQQKILDACLLRKLGSADHVGSASVFLAEHDFITGVCLPVDGGRSIYAGGMTDAIAHPRIFG
jgi:NAD(P)-dependent dehydrogenase (short-subunit alcohol dehydrogenase family)